MNTVMGQIRTSSFCCIVMNSSEAMFFLWALYEEMVGCLEQVSYQLYRRFAEYTQGAFFHPRTMGPATRKDTQSHASMEIRQYFSSKGNGLYN